MMKNINDYLNPLSGSYENGWQMALKNFEMYIAETSHSRYHFRHHKQVKKMNNEIFYQKFTQMDKIRFNFFARTALVIAFFLHPFISKADTLTLAESHTLAEAHFPILKQKALYDKTFALQWQKLRTNYLPKLSLNGQASYQSEVIELPFSLPNVEALELPHERWQVALDINQTIYDGGVTKASKTVEKDQLQIDQQQVLIDMHQLKQQVNQAYLSIILAELSGEILQSTLDLLQEKMRTMQVSLQGGVILQSEVLKIEAEMLRLQQRMADSKENSRANRTILSILIDTKVDEDTYLKIPDELTFDPEQAIHRPELKLLGLQQQKLVSHTKLLHTRTLPKVSAFAQGGYGYPHPYNFFDASVSPFYMIGARFNWNFWDWSTTRKEKEILAVQSEVLETKKESLERNIQLALERQLADIHRLERIIQDDKAIVGLQEKIRKLSSAQLDQGIITSAEYLDAVNAEQQAELNLQLHQMQLAQARINYLTEKGIF